MEYQIRPVAQTETIQDLELISKKDRLKARKRFLKFFPNGFRDNMYFDWERNYKWNAHLAWEEVLNKDRYADLLNKHKYSEIVKLAINIETKTNLLFSFEKMALRDAVKSPKGAKALAIGLYDYIYGDDSLQTRFEAFTEVLDQLPRIQTRVLTWPIQTVFGFIANPMEHIFLKPKTTKRAAENYGFSLHYNSRPNWETYENLLEFATLIESDLLDLAPRDMIDIQSFIWTIGSEEYENMSKS